MSYMSYGLHVRTNDGTVSFPSARHLPASLRGIDLGSGVNLQRVGISLARCWRCWQCWCLISAASYRL